MNSLNIVVTLVVEIDIITNFLDSFQANTVVDFFVKTRRNLKSKLDEKSKNSVETLNERQNQIKIRIDRQIKIVIKFQK